MKKKKQMHDAGYKALLSNWRIFRSFLVSFVREDWVRRIDPQRLKLVNKSFVTKDFRKAESDVLYEVRLKGGGAFYFYILVEHQRTVDHGMPFRLLQYILEILRESPAASRKGRLGRDVLLPPVIPIVLYNGKDAWTAPLQFRHMVRRHELFGDYVINFRYLLVDVAHYEVSVLRRIRNAVAGVFLLDRDLSGEDLHARLKEALGFLRREESEVILTFATWLRNVLLYHRGEKDAAKMLGTVKRRFRSKGDAIAMIETLGKRLEDAAEAKGRAEGLEQGIEKGLMDAKRHDLLAVLRARFGKPATAKIEYYVHEATSRRKLDSWLKKAAVAKSIDEVHFG